MTAVIIQINKILKEDLNEGRLQIFRLYKRLYRKCKNDM
jgi:hypothetical protein